MKTIVRLHQYITHKGISFHSFDKAIGAGNGYIGKQIKNEASIGIETLQKISSVYTDLNLVWLITGEGEMIKTENKQEHTSKPSEVDKSELLMLLKEKDDKIIELAQEIGRLKEIINRMTEK